MLYPDFKELVALEGASRSLKFGLKRQKINDISGSYISSFKGAGMEFDEVRKYAYGDDVRNIDWRVSGRLEDTYIKTFKEEKHRNVIIAVDKNDYMNFGTRKTFKNVMAAKIAAILGYAANKNSDRLGFYIFGNQRNRFTYLKPVESRSSLFKGFKILSTPDDYAESYSMEGAVFNLRRIDIKPNILFIISDFRNITEIFEKNLYLLGNRTEKVFINIIDDSDFYIPDVGRLILKHGIRRYLLNTGNKKGMNNYRKNFHEKQETLKKISNRLGAKLININTKDDLLKVLTLRLRK